MLSKMKYATSKVINRILFRILSRIIYRPKQALLGAMFQKKEKHESEVRSTFPFSGEHCILCKHRISSAYILPFNEGMKIHDDSRLFLFFPPFLSSFSTSG